MDTHNHFPMPSKQYLTKTSEHQLDFWHTAQVALIPAVSQAEIASHAEHGPDVFLRNTFLNYWHSQFIISEMIKHLKVLGHNV